MEIRYNRAMEKVVRKFNSHTEAEAAERAYYASLTPQQRLDILLDLVAMQRPKDEAADRLARVYRITQLHES